MKEISIKWSTEDVLSVRPALTIEQANQVLERLDRKHDTAIGVNWEVIDITIDDMFPDYPEKEDDEEYEFDIPEGQNMEIFLNWCIEDVLEVAPTLTEEQAEQVLDSLLRNHDATIGINWEVIEVVAEMMFPGCTNKDDDEEEESDDTWEHLKEIKHCLTCNHHDEWQETPDDAASIEDCIPHSYCKFRKCVVDDRETCEHYE